MQNPIIPMNHSRIPRPSEPDDPTAHFLRNDPGGGFMLRPAEDRLAPLAAMGIVNLGLDDKRRRYLAGAATRNHAESSQPAGKLTTGRRERSSGERRGSG